MAHISQLTQGGLKARNTLHDFRQSLKTDWHREAIVVISVQNFASNDPCVFFEVFLTRKRRLLN